MILKYTASREDEGKTVKQIIASQYALSSRMLSRLKNTGGIKVNGEIVTVRRILCFGDKLTLEDDSVVSSNIEPQDIPLDVIYEDESLLVVNKPYGMPTHPSQGHRDDTLANAVMFRYKSEKGFVFRAITRLDGDTTGAVLMARNALSAQRLTDSMQKGEIKKEYLALCVGIPKEESGIIDAPIARCEDSVIKRKIDFAKGKSAVTHYSVEKVMCDGRYTLIKAFPITGRTHQIRLHFSHIGIPIYGDFLYGTPIDGVRAYLHCRTLTFPHPLTGKTVTVTATPPEDFIPPVTEH